MTIISAIPWMAKNGQKGENHEELIRTFELEQQPISKEQIDFEAEPVNILIFDGGGMKGETSLYGYQPDHYNVDLFRIRIRVDKISD